MPIAIVVHGGASALAPEAVEPVRAACHRSVDAGWRVLSAGGSALDAAEAAVVVLEDEPLLNAGVGGHLNQAGVVELDAAIMDGGAGRLGGVIGVRTVCNPIRLARALMEAEGEPASLLAGAGAERFAEERGLPVCSPAELVTPRELARWREVAERARSKGRTAGGDTVGACALDRAGHMAAAVSTGGTEFKHPGRVGDSPLPGCGFWADDRIGAAVATGVGEDLMRVTMARLTLWLLEREGDPARAARAAVGELIARTRGEGAVIVLDRAGRPAWGSCAPQMPYAYRTESDPEPVVGIYEPAPRS